MGFADERNVPIMLVFTIFVTVLAVLGLVLGAVSLSNSSGAGPITINYPQSDGTTTSSSDTKTWMIAIGHYDNNVEYLDPETYTIKGYNVDVIDAVCDIANKNCELVWDIYENCWDHQAGERARGGPGLMGGWYDVCTGWSQTYDRLLTYQFTRPFAGPGKVAVYAKQGNPAGLPNPLNLSGRTVGFLDGWSTDEWCLARYAMSTSEVIIPGAGDVTVVHYQTTDDLIAAVNNNMVDAAFTYRLPQMAEELEQVTDDDFPNQCLAAANSMMTTKDNDEFVRWWDDAWNSLVGTKRYTDICNNINLEHGGIPGGDPADICITS